MGTNKNRYLVTVGSNSKSTLGIKHAIKCSNPEIKTVKNLTTIKTTTNNKNYSVKYLHNFVIIASPNAFLSKIWLSSISHKKILDISIKLY